MKKLLLMAGLLLSPTVYGWFDSPLVEEINKDYSFDSFRKFQGGPFSLEVSYDGVGRFTCDGGCDVKHSGNHSKIVDAGDGDWIGINCDDCAVGYINGKGYVEVVSQSGESWWERLTGSIQVGPVGIGVGKK